MWKRILVPHDFSRCAARALDVAEELAGQCQADITIVHVSVLPPNLPSDVLVTAPGAVQPTRIEEVLRSGALRDLAAVAAPLRKRGCTVQTIARVTPGSVARGLLDAAAELQPDVIVLGTHGRTGLSHLLLGSVAEKVIRGAHVPVVTVRSSEGDTVRTLEESLADDELAG